MGFIAACRAAGILIDTLPPVGVWRRFKTADKPSKRNGAVKYMGDYGLFQNHALMTSVGVWKGNDAVVPIEADCTLLALRIKERQEREKAIAAAQAHYARLAYLRGGHPYLDKKGLTLAGCADLRREGANLVVPLRRGNRMVSLQTITPDGDKKYRSGCPVTGAHLVIDRPGAALTVFAEGLATGLAVFQHVPTCRVVVCFDAGNLVAVAREWTGKGLAVIAADNDHGTEAARGVNPGLDKARQAAALLHCGVAYPIGIAGTDWADVIQEAKETAAATILLGITREARLIR